MTDESCDPRIEECFRTVTEVVQGPASAATYLGLIALTKAVLPIVLRYVVASSQISSSSSSIYKAAWGLYWTIGGVFIYGFLSLLWPFSYMPSVITNFYL